MDADSTTPENTLKNVFYQMPPSFQRHSENVAAYMAGLYEVLKAHGCSEIASYDEQTVIRAGLWHDVGKAMVPQWILDNPHRLSGTMLDVIRTHTFWGEQILQEIYGQDGKEIFSKVAGQHHERMDGHGYLEMTPGNRIHPIARMASIADTYDAITADRPYRKGRSAEEALAEISRVSGTQLDERYVAIALADTSWTNLEADRKLVEKYG